MRERIRGHARAAKPNASIPGCSGHTHYSLWDAEGKHNLFHDASDPLGMSQLMKHFLAGQLHCLPDILPMYMPFVNRCGPHRPTLRASRTQGGLAKTHPHRCAAPRAVDVRAHSYKRMVENAWAPIVATWGVENRTAAIRVINMSA